MTHNFAFLVLTLVLTLRLRVLPELPLAVRSKLGTSGSRSRSRLAGICWRRMCHTPRRRSLRRCSGASLAGSVRLRRRMNLESAAACGRHSVHSNRRCASDAIADSNVLAVGSSACEKGRVLVGGSTPSGCPTAMFKLVVSGLVVHMSSACAASIAGADGTKLAWAL